MDKLVNREKIIQVVKNIKGLPSSKHDKMVEYLFLNDKKEYNEIEILNYIESINDNKRDFHKYNELKKSIKNLYNLYNNNSIEKNITLYHGSNEIFDTFKISKELAHHDIESVLPEGLGIYLTNKKEIAKSYGELYTVEINKKNILDFTSFKSCKKIITNFLKVYDTESLLESIDDTINSIIDDRVQIIEMIKDIVLWNEEEIYSTINDTFDFYDYEEKITQNWNDYINQYCLKYNSNDLGVVYVAKNTEILNIIK